jgi:hypothetical protein
VNIPFLLPGKTSEPAAFVGISDPVYLSKEAGCEKCRERRERYRLFLSRVHGSFTAEYRSGCLRRFASPYKGFAKQRPGPGKMCRNEAWEAQPT